MISNKQAKVCW